MLNNLTPDLDMPQTGEENRKGVELKNVETKGLNFAGLKQGIINTKIGNNTKIAYIGYAKKIFLKIERKNRKEEK